MDRKNLFRRVVLSLAACLWAGGIAYGLHALYDHETKPGLAARAPAILPAMASLPAVDDKPLLLMFIHPQCPCTRASLRELDRLRSEVGSVNMDVAVVVMTGESLELQFENGLGMQAQQMTGVQIIQDPQGQLARSMSVWTSGQVLLYDAAGSLRFSGGITRSRGHEGDSLGRQIIRDFVLHGEQPSQASVAVFGCAIQTAGDMPSPVSMNQQKEAGVCCIRK